MTSLWQAAAGDQPNPQTTFLAPGHRVPAASLLNGTVLGDPEQFRDRNVVLATYAQLPSALALLELDGVARRVVLCTPDLSDEQFAAVARTADTDILLVDQDTSRSLDGVARVVASAEPEARALERRASRKTEWVLLTSGTTGIPKLVSHSLDSLAGGLRKNVLAAPDRVWSTFYDIRRYGGLQIYLRAVLSGARLVLSSANEEMKSFLTRLREAGVTHISGTPSHWRRALMSGYSGLIAPEYARLSGEIADQVILDNLKQAYPRAGVSHAFASTEAGVAFDIDDGQAGFPAALLDRRDAAIELKVHDGSLWIRSARRAAGYIGAGNELSMDAEGYLDTGDLVELERGRYQFRGRKGGIINIGGLKVYPEEVEAILNADARVRASLVRAKKSPITGALIVADVMLTEEAKNMDNESLKSDLLGACRQQLAAHKVPAMLRFVAALEMSAAGKLVRRNG